MKYPLKFVAFVFFSIMLLGCSTRYAYLQKIKVDKSGKYQSLEEIIEIQGKAHKLTSQASLVLKGFGKQQPMICQTKPPNGRLIYVGSTQKKPLLHSVKAKPPVVFPKAKSKADPWFTAFLIAMVLGLILLLSFGSPALLALVFVVLLLAFVLLKLIRLFSKRMKNDDHPGPADPLKDKQNMRHVGVIVLLVFMLLAVLLLSLSLYFLIIPFLLCVPLLLVSLSAFRHETKPARKGFYILAMLISALTILFFLGLFTGVIPI